jgi:NAD(P)-dependent dehydrogenase (short-subunit alcohol dehydrogenase family)
LGRELARQYAASGRRVFACRRHLHDLPPVETNVVWKKLDTGNENSIAALADDLRHEAIDILINNAAQRGDTGGLDTLRTDDFLATIRVNALGPLLMAKAFLPHVARSRRRIIANISSRAGSISEGLDLDGDYAYRCSKAALNMATAKLAFDHQLIFLALHPGWVRTDMGGPDAEVPPKASASGLIAIIEQATLSDSGTFRGYDGRSIGW